MIENIYTWVYSVIRYAQEYIPSLHSIYPIIPNYQFKTIDVNEMLLIVDYWEAKLTSKTCVEYQY